MAEHFRFFDAVETNGQYDREYNAQEFTDYFKALVTTGVMKGAGNQLAVTANGSNMVTSINTGIAFILGRFYENDAPLTFTHDTETLGLNRIDRIVIRMDQNVDARHVKAFLKKGTASTNPAPPALTQNNTVYEISLAQARIVGGQTFISSTAVTDERGTDVICPWAGSNILPNFNNDTILAELGNKADKQQENWIPVVYEAGWSNVGAWSPLRYYKDSFGVVHLAGTANKVSGGTAITYLPIGYRPNSLLAGWSGTGDLMTVHPDGKVESTSSGLIPIRVSFRTD